MKVRNEEFQKVLKYGLYTLDEADGDIDTICNLCGNHYELPCDVIDHIIDVHLDDELPDAVPYDEESGHPIWCNLE